MALFSLHDRLAPTSKSCWRWRWCWWLKVGDDLWMLVTSFEYCYKKDSGFSLSKWPKLSTSWWHQHRIVVINTFRLQHHCIRRIFACKSATARLLGYTVFRWLSYNLDAFYQTHFGFGNLTISFNERLWNTCSCQEQLEKPEVGKFNMKLERMKLENGNILTFQHQQELSNCRETSQLRSILFN